MANLAIPALLGLASYMTRNKQQENPAANRTDNTQIMGANQDTEDMEAGQAQNAASMAASMAAPAKPAMQADENQSQAEVNRLMNQNANATGTPVSPSVMTQKNPSFKQAFAQARLAGEPTFTWAGKPGVTFTTKYETETTPAKTKPNAPPQVTSVPDQSDAETKRLKAENTKALDYDNKSDIGADVDYSIYMRGLPKDKNNKMDVDQLLNNVKTQDAKEGIKRTPSQYNQIRKRALGYNIFTENSNPKKSTSNGVPTPEEAAANRKAAIDKVASVGKSVSDYVNNFETPAERSSRERKEKAANPNAKGGKIKAFAKGGSVSSRGDGIAKKGHTKGRMV